MGEIINKVKGKIKQAVGDIAGDPALREEGVRDERKGRVQGVIADVKHAAKVVEKDAKNVIDDVLKK